MKEIPLTKGYVALIDDADLELVSQYSWSADVRRHTVYAQAYTGGGRAGHKKISLHRLITNAGVEQEVDHRDNNGLNCQRANLRLCTNHQNHWNRPKHGTSGHPRYKGVKPTGPRKRRWQASIGLNNKSINLGKFYSAEEAAYAYDIAAREHFGEFAWTNFASVQ